MVSQDWISSHILGFDMKRFLVRLMLVVAPAFLVALAACVITMVFDGKSPSNYQRGFVCQVRALEHADPRVSKVLFVGGSYLTFSMDEKTAYKMLPMPSYCLGLHSGMGMCYIFETAKRFVHKGDLVVFPFSAFTKDDYGMPLIYLALRGETDLQKGFLWQHPLAVLSSIAPYSFHRWVTRLEPVIRGRRSGLTGYPWQAFNPTNGFYNLERTSKWDSSRLDLPVAFAIDSVDSGCFEVLNDFEAFCRGKGARFILAHAPIVEDAVSSSLSEMQRYDQDLADHLTAPFVLHAVDPRFSAELIYDFPRHLTSVGAVKYTQMLCEGINSFMRMKCTLDD